MMRIMLDNVQLQSRSGPNGFGLKIATALSMRGHTVVEKHESPDVQLSFIQATQRLEGLPIVQRLDGIWFNSAQDWQLLNRPIRDTYKRVEGVIVQSEFDRRLVENYFGARMNMHVIHNGTDVEAIQSCDALHVPELHDVEKVWTCASAWRPHKRLGENIRYFMEHSGPKDVLIIAGKDPDVRIADTRVFYAGDLERDALISLLRATDTFIHCAYIDHCPNVVVDARAAGCHIICSSTGGTEEIAGLDSTIILEDEWDFKPCELYNPPKMDFSLVRQGRFDTSIDIGYVAERYEYVLQSVL